MIAQLEVKSIPAKEQSKQSFATLDALSSLRFFACLCVIMVHAQSMQLVHIFPDARALCAWSQALPFFFAMSGFVLSYNYRAMPTAKERLQYLLNRAARILPMYYITGLACLTIPTLCVLGAEYNHVSYFVLMQDWFKLNGLHFPLNSAAHSMSTELLYYLMFVVLISVGRYKSIPISLLMLGSMTCLDFHQFVDTRYSIQPYTFGKFFLFGMLFELVYEKVAPRLRASRSTLAFTLLEIGSLLGAGIFAYKVSYPPADESLWHFGTTTIAAIPILHVIEAMTFSFLLFVFAIEKGLIARLLKNQILVALGLSSYALFLIHYPVETMLMTRISEYSSADKLGLTVATVLAMIVSSYFIFLHSEEPIRRFILKASKQRIKVSCWLKQSLRLLLPLAAIWLIVPSLIGVETTARGFYRFFTSPSGEQIWKAYQAAVIAGTENVSFTGGDKLLGAKLVSVQTGSGNKKLSLETLWKDEKPMSDRGYLAVHMLDASGKIVHNLDHKITPSRCFPGQPWLDSVTLPVLQYPGAVALAIGIYRDGRGQLEDVNAPAAKVIYGKMLTVPLP